VILRGCRTSLNVCADEPTGQFYLSFRQRSTKHDRKAGKPLLAGTVLRGALGYGAAWGRRAFMESHHDPSRLPSQETCLSRKIARQATSLRANRRSEIMKSKLVPSAI
jgi:hypothetical protein